MVKMFKIYFKTWFY